MAAIAALALLLDGCAQPSDPQIAQRLAEHPSTGVKVLLVGIDGATFTIIDPMISQGRLPTLAGLIERGARGPLWSQNPMISPALWTTVVTGQPRGVHGIVDFLDDDSDEERRLFTAADRRSPALWNLTGPFGRSVGFAGWWTSWPAEPVDGWMLSDRMVRSRWSAWGDGTRERATTWPPELAEELADLVVDPLDPPLDELLSLAPFSDGEIAEMRAAERPVFGHGPSVLKFAWCSQRSYEEMVLEMVSRSQPDLLGLFLTAVDPTSHIYWHLFEPRAYKGVDRRQARRLRPLIPNVYVHNDRFLGDLLGSLDPDTVVMVTSDHGFRASGKLPRPRHVAEADAQQGVVAMGQSGRHARRGVFIAAGGPIRQGTVVDSTLLDIAPTILALLGMPVPDDMPGRVLEEILEPEFLAEHPIRRIHSYRDLLDFQPPALPEEVEDPEAMEMLRSLGYVE
jgi:predicted AlkP superfamily phosphohydrolase/phosphomutase